MSAARLARLLSLILAGLLGLSGVGEADPALGPNYFDYQVDIGAPPQNATEAMRSMDARMQAVLQTVACGTEFDYASDFVSHEANEDSASRVLAKLEWGDGHPEHNEPRVRGYCRFSMTLRWGDFLTQRVCTLLRDAASCDDPDDKTRLDKLAAVADTVWPSVMANDLSAVKDKILAVTLPGDVAECQRGMPDGNGPLADRSIVGWRLLDPYPGSGGAAAARQGAVQIDFAISQFCLIRQVANSLSTFVIPTKDGKQQVAGTDGGPCHLFGKVYGDWDMAERNLIRIAYLIKRSGLDADGQPLHDAYANLRNNLLTLDRGTEGDSHSAVFGCGNSDGHTGSPEDRALDRSDSGKSRENALGDLGWFLLMLLLLLIAAVIVAAVLVAAGVAGAIAAAVAAAIVVGTFIFAQIPETENHLLGINTTKYLNNQLIIQDLGNDITLTGPYIKDQIELKEWLLKRFQSYLQNDFIEYNARPYQRHAIESIRNIFDFAGDPGRPTLPDDDLRNAAAMVLDYTAAKFAVGNSQTRRIVPYRRHRSDFAKVVDTDASGWNGLIDSASSADHQIGLGLLYSGQTQLLPLGQASKSFAGEIINAATSTYVPPPTILDLSIVKDVPIYQRIHHATEEIYSGSKGFLISAGSLATGLAYPVTGIPAIDGHVDDWGSGVPTTLFLTGDPVPDLEGLADPPAPGATDPKSIAQQIYQAQRLLPGPGRAPAISGLIPFDSSTNGIYAPYLGDMHPDPRLRSTIGELIRIKGEFHLDTEKNDDGTINRMPTYDNNLCVWDGFACGTNIELGPMATDCQAVTMEPWTFIDSHLCKGRENAPRTFIALLKKDCPASENCTNYGFYEVIDADTFIGLHPPAAGEDPFAKFRGEILNDNAGLDGLPAGKNNLSTYQSTRGQKIEFSCWGHESDSDQWGIYSVDGVRTHDLGAWPFAGGEWTSSGSMLPPEVQTPMHGIGDGLVTVTSPRLKSFADPTKPRVLTLDFSDRDHPKAPVEQ